MPSYRISLPPRTIHPHTLRTSLRRVSLRRDRQRDQIHDAIRRIRQDWYDMHPSRRTKAQVKINRLLARLVRLAGQR